MSVNVQRDLEAKLRASAAERGMSVETYVENLVRADPRPIDPLDPQKAVLLEALQLNHGKGVGSTYYRQLELDPDVETQILSRALADGIGPEDYIRRFLARP
jgi:hypothetical protein